MESIMNNEEIREKIREHQMAIQEELAKSYNFELNPEIMKSDISIFALLLFQGSCCTFVHSIIYA